MILKFNIIFTLSFIAFLLCSSCNSFLEVDLPKNLVVRNEVFRNDVSAESAVKGIYVNMLDAMSFACGSDKSVVALAGLSADELDNYYNANDYISFEENDLRSNDSYVLALWNSMYKSIYDANAVIEGLSSSTGVSEGARNQLIGEALFIRAFAHFYLVNFFGDCPIVTATDYRLNSVVSRSDKNVVYNQIIDDLIKAKGLLESNYAISERVRPNKGAATALLARVYLYTKDWIKAEIESSSVIDDSSIYKISDDLSGVFLINSEEAIWQLSFPANSYISTYEGAYFILESEYDLYYNTLRDDFLNSFEAGDQRLDSWVGTFVFNSDTIYFPYKYKIKSGGATSEYSMVLRLAEQYLIRAEARFHLAKNFEGCKDLNVIRRRAGLDDVLVTNEAMLLLAVERERKTELFAEWGHRWLDLKRTDRASQVLGIIKDSWDDTDVLYPIPQMERDKNLNLRPQNLGY
jgi:hypothetical protein